MTPWLVGGALEEDWTAGILERAEAAYASGSHRTALRKLNEAQAKAEPVFRTDALVRLLRCSVALLCMVACGSVPPASFLESVQRVAILPEGPPPGGLRARGRIESAFRGAGSASAEAISQCGNAGGGGDFAAVGLILCVGLATTLGGIGGGVLGAMEGLPAEAVRELNEDLEAYLRQQSLDGEFVRILSDRIASRRAVSTDHPDLVLFVRLREVRLEQHTKRQLSLALAASVRLEFPEISSSKRRYERGYQYESMRRDVDTWLAGHGAGVAEQIRSAFAGLSDEITRDLWDPAPERRRGWRASNRLAPMSRRGDGPATSFGLQPFETGAENLEPTGGFEPPTC